MRRSAKDHGFGGEQRGGPVDLRLEPAGERASFEKNGLLREPVERPSPATCSRVSIAATPPADL